MNQLPIANISSGHPSDVITDTLGIVAVCAFCGIAAYIGLMLLKDSSKRRVSMENLNLDAFAPQDKPMVAKQESTEEIDRRKVEEACEAFLNKVLEEGFMKAQMVVQFANEAFRRVANGYASASYGLEGENATARCQKFTSVCERQWGFLRSDLGFMSYLDVQEHLRHILDNHRMLRFETVQKESDASDMSPELLRSQELVALARVVAKDKVKLLQSDLIDAASDYRNSFDQEVLTWLNDTMNRLTTEMRKKYRGSIQITDTEYYDRFRRLRTRLEIVGNLSDRVGKSTQRLGESSLVLSQVIYIGTVLRILASLPEWFKDFELEPEDAELEAG